MKKIDKKWEAFFEMLDKYNFQVYDLLMAIAAQLANNPQDEFKTSISIGNKLISFDITKKNIQ